MAYNILTFDVGGSAIKYALCSDDAKLSHKGQVPTPQEVDSTIEDFIGQISSVVDSFKERNIAFEGIAISMPGCIEDNGTMRTGGALVYNFGQNIADLVEKATSYRPAIINDAKAAAAAELGVGSLQNVSMGAVLILGTGLGGGIIVNGQVLNGPQGSAGELSAFVMNCRDFEQDRACCAQIISATGLILRVCEALDLDYVFSPHAYERQFPLDGKKIFELYHQGNEKVIAAVEDFGYETGKLIYNLSVVLNLEKVAIGGGISAQDCLIEAIVRGTKKAWQSNPLRSLDPPLVVMPEVCVCQFHNDANIIGAMYHYLKVNKLK